MDAILSILSGGTTGALLVWLLRGWISERIKQSIQHEYSQKLETHKAELNTRIQALQHENQLQQLRTSLFFDHQRNAFAGILAKIAEVNQTWINKEYEDEVGLTGPVPYEAYKELRTMYSQHQLFLDNSCLAALDLIFECYVDSFPFDDGSGGPPIQRDVETAHEGVEYLQPRIAELFQRKIGMSENDLAMREIALFGAIKLLNHYHFSDIQLPVTGVLKLTSRDQPADAVAKAQEHINELVSKLKDLHDYLGREHGMFHEARTKASRYLGMLESTSTATHEVI
jgi:hypothetical protein